MDCQKVGTLIYHIRKEKHMTQKELAQLLRISDKTVSKWERGLGCPDVSLLGELSDVLGVHIEKLLSGDLDQNHADQGNMKKIRFYVCPQCGNIITSTAPAELSCCGRRLEALTPVKAEEQDKLSIELVEDEWFISSDHEMTKDHYLSFIAFATGDTVTIIRQYPEWNLQTRLRMRKHGMLFWYCTNHGLFYQLV